MLGIRMKEWWLVRVGWGVWNVWGCWVAWRGLLGACCVMPVNLKAAAHLFKNKVGLLS